MLIKNKGEIKMENTEVQETTMRSLRSAIMGTIFGIKNGDIPHEDGLAVAKLGNTMIQSYRADIEAVKVANDLKEPNRAYSRVLDMQVIETKALPNE